MKNIKVILLWFDFKEGVGSVQDINGNEYHIDNSVLFFNPKDMMSSKMTVRSGLELIIDKNVNVKTCNCAMNVRKIE